MYDKIKQFIKENNITENEVLVAIHNVTAERIVEKLKERGGSVVFESDNQPSMICDSLDDICDVFIDKVELDENDKLVFLGHEMYGKFHEVLGNDFKYDKADFAYGQLHHVLESI